MGCLEKPFVASSNSITGFSEFEELKLDFTQVIRGPMMYHFRHHFLAVIFFVFLVLIGCGCNDEENPCTPEIPATATIFVDSSPDSLNVPWTLSGPAEFLSAGTGDLTINGLALGTYTIEWGDVPDWEKPNPHVLSLTLAEGETRTFAGSYSEVRIPTGTIQIESAPEDLDVSWLLAGPNGTNFSGENDSTLTEMAIGEYSVTWESASGWEAPDVLSQVLLDGETVTFSGEYSIILPPNTTTGILMANFVEIYERMLHEDYDSFLHPDYLYILSDETVADWEHSEFPFSEPYFDKDAALNIHGNIFSGSDGMNRFGDLVSPIQSINVLLLDQLASWTQVDESHQYFGGQDAYYNRYRVVIQFQTAEVRFDVNQDMDFYIKIVDGILYLLGQEGLPLWATATESITFDDVLALYR